MSIQTALRRLLFPPEVKAPLWSLATLWQMLRYMLTGLVGFVGLSAPLLRRYLVFPQGTEEKAK